MTRETILVLDDSEICLDLARSALESAGFSVVTASSPLGANRLLRQSNAACVVVDVSMPALSGDKLVEIIRRSFDQKRVPILLHSDRALSELAELAKKCGADAAVPKTEDCRVLVREVQRMLGQSK